MHGAQEEQSVATLPTIPICVEVDAADKVCLLVQS